MRKLLPNIVGKYKGKNADPLLHFVNTNPKIQMGIYQFVDDVDTGQIHAVFAIEVIFENNLTIVVRV
jgi:hypothetical protein